MKSKAFPSDNINLLYIVLYMHKRVCEYVATIRCIHYTYEIEKFGEMAREASMRVSVRASRGYICFILQIVVGCWFVSPTENYLY